MKYITSLLIALSVAIQLSAKPEVISATQINPPVYWANSNDLKRISDEPWLHAFLAWRKPQGTTFKEWSKYCSDALKSSDDYTELAFKEMVSEKIKEEKDQSRKRSIRTVNKFKNEGKDYIAILVVDEFREKFQNEVMGMSFFTLNGDHYIYAAIPTDIPFSSPILGLDFGAYLNPPLKPAVEASKK